MKIDVIVAKLQKKGYSEENAKVFASYVVTKAKELGIDPFDLLNEETYKTVLTELGDTKLNDARVRGYITGKKKNTLPSANIQRNIIK